MASYMDMVTVLMCMFIVLFAMSAVDTDKYEKLRNSLATGFGVVDDGKIDTATGIVVPPDQADVRTRRASPTCSWPSTEVDQLTALQEQMQRRT